MQLALPPAAQIGQTIGAQARLLDDKGAPIANATVKFTTAADFLGSTGRVLIADAITDRTGTVTVQFDLRTAGAYEVRAAYGGDDLHAFSNATATINVSGAEQLYVQQGGILVPGLNEAPVVGRVGASEDSGILRLLAGLWPAMSGWPIALTLIIVWSLYGYVAILAARISRAESPA